MPLKLLILILGSLAAILLGVSLLPLLLEKLQRQQEKRVKEASLKLETMFIKIETKRLNLILAFVPVIISGVGFLIMRNLLGLLAGLAVGAIIPSFIIKNIEGRRRNKFNSQLIDTLMLMSSSLRGGLSLLQTIEVVTEEMPKPIGQEFGIILQENKMGIPLEVSFEHLNKRMPSHALNLITTAILLARQTGGDLPVVFSRLVAALREQNKITQQVKTLTLQGRIQGVIMSILPIVFAIFVYGFNKQFFDLMLKDPLGHKLLIYALCSEIVGIVLIRKISKVDV